MSAPASDREMLVMVLGGLHEIGDELQISTPANALRTTIELARDVHDHLVRHEAPVIAEGWYALSVSLRREIADLRERLARYEEGAA